MSRKPLNWSELTAKAKTAPPPQAEAPAGFADRVWEAMQPSRGAAATDRVELRLGADPNRSVGLWGLGWCAAASIAVAIMLLAFNRDLFDLAQAPHSPLVDEIAALDWTALDSVR